MSKGATTHNTLHVALYTPERYYTTGFKQLVKDDITRILQKAKPACYRDGTLHSAAEVIVSTD